MLLGGATHAMRCDTASAIKRSPLMLLRAVTRVVKGKPECAVKGEMSDD
jgi:hypothetical protein